MVLWVFIVLHFSLLSKNEGTWSVYSITLYTAIDALVLFTLLSNNEDARGVYSVAHFCQRTRVQGLHTVLIFTLLSKI